ncbi:MAG: NUDIX domain-containing protein, partial [Lysobacterales bacterium]
MIERGGAYLLVEEAIHGQKLVNQPAGHLEPGESLVDAAVRETREETGWQVILTGLIGVYQWVSPNSREQYVRFAFAAVVEAHDEAQALDAGILRALW